MPRRLRPTVLRSALWTGAVLVAAGGALVVGRVETGGQRPALPPLEVPAVPDAPSLPPARPAARPWNLVLISIDTLRADRLSLYRHERVTSPALDAFARDALVFEHAYSQSPKTAESHMTLLTGLYPVAHGVRNLRHEGERLAGPIPTLATLLRRAGYRTVGYHGAGNLDAELGFDQGFDVYEHPGNADAVFARGSAWLERAVGDDGARPFFLFLHTKVLHDPYDPPPEYAALYTDPDYAGDIGMSLAERRAAQAEGGWQGVYERYWSEVDARDPADVQHLRDLYDALIRYMDDQLGPFLARLRALGLERDTLVVFTSDHGEEFLDHRGFRHGSVYREVLHVPLVVRGPDAAGLRAGREAQIVSLVDVLPTLLELLGLATPDHLQGRSFAALLRGEPAAPRPVYSEWAARGNRSLRLGDWKYVDRVVSEELYHVADDPDEQRDLSRERPELAARLRAETDRLSAATRGFAEAVGTGESFRVRPELREQLEALGYLEGGG